MSSNFKIYAKGEKGVEFAGSLENEDIPNNPQIKTLEDQQMVYVIFKKPDGTILKKNATVVDEGDDDDPTNDIVIRYQDTNDGSQEGSILDQKGTWSYTVAAEFTNDTYIESVFREIFAVQ